MWIRENIQYLVFVVMIGGVITAPMYYTRNGDDAFEPELVPVSSTVIPIASHSINATDDAQNLHSPSLDEEYRMAYIKLLHRNVSRTVDDSDTFITLTKKYHPEKKIHIRKEVKRYE